MDKSVIINHFSNHYDKFYGKYLKDIKRAGAN